MSIFDHSDYRSVIQEWERLSGNQATRSRLAKAAGCTPSWISRVMTGSVQMTPDQAAALASYFHFSETETDYFLLLVDLERAATPTLKNRISKKLEVLRRESRKLATSVKAGQSVKEQNAARYYSSWIYSALHVSCMIEPQTLEGLSGSLRLVPDTTVARLKELEQMGLLTLRNGKWEANARNVHLPSDHPASLTGHVSWRHRTIQQLFETHERGLHYSAVHCLSQTDVQKVRELLKKAVLNCRDIIETSPSETMGVLCLDWYELQ